MKIGIIGPNSIDGDIKERKRLLDKVAEILAKSGHENSAYARQELFTGIFWI